MSVENDSNSAIAALHERVDSAVAPLTARHAARLRCALGCTKCCVDDLTVTAAEAERISRAFPDVLTTSPGPSGACAFLGERGQCRVYEARPYVCRTQGLPLRWFAEHEGEMAAFADICPLNDAPGDEPLEALEAEDFWLLGPVEGELALISADRPRVALRGLFHG